MDVLAEAGLHYTPAFPPPGAVRVEVSDIAWLDRRGTQQYGGTVTVSGAPAERLVQLLDLRCKGVLEQCLSNPSTGAWATVGRWSTDHAYLALCVEGGDYQAIPYDRV